MWAYEKKLQYPVKIKNPNPTYAKIIISQLGGPDGELAAATRYLNQRYSMPNGEIIGILTDIGTEANKKTQGDKDQSPYSPVSQFLFSENYSQFLSTRSTKNLCFSFSLKRS